MRSLLSRSKSSKEDKERDRDRKDNSYRSSSNYNPFRRAPPFQAPPPPYSGPSPSNGATPHEIYSTPAATDSRPQPSLSLSQQATSFRGVESADPYAGLARFDTVFMIDDSSSMTGERWNQTRKALAEIVPICTKYDKDGVDVHFLNATHIQGSNIKSPAKVTRLFELAQPRGTTPTGRRLKGLLDQYLDIYRVNRKIKPLNIICITDGEPTDPSILEDALIEAAKQLDMLDAPDRQVGVQFFQVGSDMQATQALEELDNGLAEEGIRDMVDTVSWKRMNEGNGLTGEGVLKAVMGAVDKGLDRKRRLH